MMTRKIRILLGITGSIAAYKIPELLRQLLKANFEVKIMMTETALSFVSHLTLETLLPNSVYSGLIESQMQHIQLAKWADTILIAPITANHIAKICYGFSDDLLSACCLVTKAPIIIAPAMNQAMWQHPCTQANIAALKARGIQFIGPEPGEQACKDEGLGRMSEPATIMAQLNAFTTPPLLEGKRILISMGATQEAIDPVRFISNKSSGKMGAALAQAAFLAKAQVTIVCGKTTVANPPCHRLIAVTTAKEIYHAVHSALPEQDIFISVAAISDYEVANIAPQKIKHDKNALTLTLHPTRDILASVCQQTPRPFTVGFSAETENIMENTKKKLTKKGADMLVVNDVSQTGIGFDTEENAVSILSKYDTPIIHLEKTTKQEIATQLLHIIFSAYQENTLSKQHSLCE